MKKNRVSTDSGDANNPPQKPKRDVTAVIFVAVILLAAGGSVALYFLGRPLPQETASAPIAWGDRVERRMDAFIDGSRPKWADSLETRLKKFASRAGWK
ncbi:MAG: hypothetical protein V4671_27215 [Armatimonadota bacterium]